MRNEFDQFAQDLRSLVPGGCEHLAEETFYQAGRAAAVQQFEAMRLQSVEFSRPRSKWYRHPVAVFSSGMAVGLVVFAAVWNDANSRAGTTESVATIERPEMQTNPAVPDRAAVASLNQADNDHSGLPVLQPTSGGMSSMIASIFPWASSTSSELSMKLNSPTDALSRAAQHQWSSLLQPDHVTCRHSAEAASGVSEPQTRPLQVSPLRNGMMKEFL